MSLLSQTAALGIYDLRPGSMIRCEIESYQAALDLLPPLLASVSSLPDGCPRSNSADGAHSMDLHPRRG